VTAGSKGGDSCVGEGRAPPEAQGLEVLEAGDGVGDQGWNVSLSTPGKGKAGTVSVSPPVDERVSRLEDLR
jgi:hypothetical protein